VPFDVAAGGTGRGEGQAILDGDLVGVGADGDLGGLACVRQSDLDPLGRDSLIFQAPPTSVWRLEMFARGGLAGNEESWQAARSAVNSARSAFYESARRDLEVKGGGLPDADDFEARVRRVRGDLPA
jgi:hypothetical protein